MTVWIEAPFDSLPLEGYRKQRYWLMAEAFLRAGHSVVYWTSDFSHARKARRRVVRVEEIGKLCLVFVPTRPYDKNVCLRRILSHRAYAREWERMARRAIDAGERLPDLIVVSAPPVATGAVALRLARRFGARLVVDVQDAWPETFYRLLPRGLQWVGKLLLLPVRAAVRRLYRDADLVTGTSDRYGELVRRAGARDYYRAYLGIDIPLSSAREPAGTGLRLAYVGNLGRGYDLRTVVAGVRELRAKGRDVTLEIAGFGDASALAGDGVRFHGMLDRLALAELLATCDAGVIPMRSDSYVGVPNKLGEYAAAGLRVVSSLAGETQVLLEKNGCGVTYRPGDVESFIAAVERLPTDCANTASVLAEGELNARRIYSAYVADVGKSNRTPRTEPKANWNR